MADAAQPCVLLVDDDANVLSALRRSLRREKVGLQLARNATEALACLAQEPVALVISDHRMPGQSGVELLKTVRARWPGTRRILLSGWTSEISPADLKAADLFEVLTKPWDDAVLRAAVRGAVGREGA